VRSGRIDLVGQVLVERHPDERGGQAGQLVGVDESRQLVGVGGQPDGPAILAVLRFAPATLDDDRPEVSVRGELAAVRLWRVWATLATMVLAQAGFLGAYSQLYQPAAD
jgi:hypothetical protein